jgi:hypothetical protein
MPKLHLVAITPDHKGLVLSEHAGSKRGDLVLEIDDRLLDAIEKAQRLRARHEGQQLESAALPSRRERPADDASPGGRLSPREIQQRLRAGETVTAIARSAGVDEDWVRRFATPVLAELEIVVDKAKAAVFTKPRVGPSSMPLGSSVASNVMERGAEVTVAELDGSWAAYVRPDGGWSITFSYPQKGRRQKAEWAFDADSGEVSARNKLATELGYREPGQRPPAGTAKPKAASKSKPPAAKRPADAPEEDPFEDGSQTLPGTDVGPELSEADILPPHPRRPPTAKKAPPRKAASGKPPAMGRPAGPGSAGPPPGFEPEIADDDAFPGELEIAGEDDDGGIPVLSASEFSPEIAAPLEATPETVEPGEERPTEA